MVVNQFKSIVIVVLGSCIAEDGWDGEWFRKMKFYVIEYRAENCLILIKISFYSCIQSILNSVGTWLISQLSWPALQTYGGGCEWQLKISRSYYCLFILTLSSSHLRISLQTRSNAFIRRWWISQLEKQSISLAFHPSSPHVAMRFKAPILRSENELPWAHVFQFLIPNLSMVGGEKWPLKRPRWRRGWRRQSTAWCWAN